MGGSQSLFIVIGVIIMELDGTCMIREWYTSNHCLPFESTPFKYEFI